MKPDELLSPEIRALLASQRELQESVLGPANRIVDEIVRRHEELLRPYRDLLTTVEETAQSFAVTRYTPSPEIDTVLRRLEVPLLEELRRSVHIPPMPPGLITASDVSRLIDDLSGLPTIARITSWYAQPAPGVLDGATLGVLLSPLERHAAFAADTLTRLGAETNVARRAALAIAIRHTAIERDLYTDALVYLPPPRETLSSDPLPYTAGPDGRDELLARAEHLGPDDAALAAPTVAHDLVLLVGELFRLLALVNGAAKATGRPEIFPPTSTVYVASSVLFLTIARTADDFARVVNALYRLLYEGAGADSLRLLTDHGGPLTDAECTALWWLKDLRLFEFHDVDRGDAGKGRAKWRKYGTTLTAMGLHGLPSTPEDFVLLQRRLYEALVALLRSALSALPLTSPL